MSGWSVNPLVTNGLSHSYHLDESTFIYRGIRNDFSFLFYFSMKIKIANRKAPDGTPRFAASHLGLFCLPTSHKKDARLIWVNLPNCCWASLPQAVYQYSVPFHLPETDNLLFFASRRGRKVYTKECSGHEGIFWGSLHTKWIH